jgi:hypothetical protein
MKKIFLILISVLFYSCSGRNTKKTDIIDTLVVDFDKNMHIVSLFKDKTINKQYIENYGEIDGQFLEFDDRGRVIKKTYFVEGHPICFENSYYSNNQLDSTTIGNYTAEGTMIRGRKAYLNGKIIDNNSPYFSISPNNGIMKNDTVTFTKYGDYITLLVLGNFINGEFVPGRDTINITDRKYIIYPNEHDCFYRLSGQVLFLVMNDSKYIVDTRLSFVNYFYRL